ncbi:helix-turn-helix domain-containing protein [Methylobacillus sp. Pita2]|uniref:helix-turn-helix domain-containing protein n=1 Tax=Methylobacillus TaxID=404 RepID=UPI002853E3AA|nr:helix-turn-helix transcriptional regulator [Methylobacillus flagellatus]MDR5170970.1 helix-turn-helix transcriptional regulator [Methylobacillus flagellatus]
MKDSLRKKLGLSIATRRKNLGLTQEFVAQRLGVEIETVSRIERGVTAPSLKTLNKIAHELSSPIQEFFEASSPVSVDPDIEGLVAILQNLEEKDRKYVIEATKSLSKHLLKRVN